MPGAKGVNFLEFTAEAKRCAFTVRPGIDPAAPSNRAYRSWFRVSAFPGWI
jgi:hypothetical protein